MATRIINGRENRKLGRIRKWLPNLTEYGRKATAWALMRGEALLVLASSGGEDISCGGGLFNECSCATKEKGGGVAWMGEKKGEEKKEREKEMWGVCSGFSKIISNM